MINGEQPLDGNNAPPPAIQNIVPAPPPVVNNAPPPTHVLVSKLRYGFLRRLEPQAIPQDDVGRGELLNGLKSTKAKLKEDLTNHKGRPFLLFLILVAFMGVMLISQIYGDNKKHNKDDNSVNYGTDIASFVGAVVAAVLAYVVKTQQTRDEQHLKEVKDSRETLKGMSGP